jgi:hypothetical protein
MYYFISKIASEVPASSILVVDVSPFWSHIQVRVELYPLCGTLLARCVHKCMARSKINSALEKINGALEKSAARSKI